MLSNFERDLINIIGLIVSFIGFIIVFLQIRKTKKAALAAKEASIESSKALQSNLALVDLPSSIKMVEDVKEFIRKRRFEVALLRIGDIITQFIHIRHLNIMSGEELQSIFISSLSQLDILRESLEQKNNNSEYDFQSMEAVKILSNISDSMNDLIGQKKFGGKYDT